MGLVQYWIPPIWYWIPPYQNGYMYVTNPTCLYCALAVFGAVQPGGDLLRWFRSLPLEWEGEATL